MWYSSQDLNDDLNDNDDDYISHNGPLMCLKVWHRILAPPPLEVPAQPVKLWMFRALLQSTLPIGLVITTMVTLHTKSGSCRRFGTATYGEQLPLTLKKTFASHITCTVLNFTLWLPGSNRWRVGVVWRARWKAGRAPPPDPPKGPQLCCPPCTRVHGIRGWVVLTFHSFQCHEKFEAKLEKRHQSTNQCAVFSEVSFLVEHIDRK